MGCAGKQPDLCKIKHKQAKAKRNKSWQSPCYSSAAVAHAAVKPGYGPSGNRGWEDLMACLTSRNIQERRNLQVNLKFRVKCFRLKAPTVNVFAHFFLAVPVRTFLKRTICLVLGIKVRFGFRGGLSWQLLPVQ